MESNQILTTVSPRLRPDECPAYILAGGLSSRFGSDKARVEVDTEPLLLVLRRSLIEQGHAVEVVANRIDRYEDLGITCLVDRQANQGPLAGVASALAHRQQRDSGWLLLLSCDLLVWHSAWFDQLSSGIQFAAAELQGNNSEAAKSELDAVGFVSRSDGKQRRWEPFPSLLHSRLLPQVIQRLDGGQPSPLQTLFDHARSAAIESDLHDNPQAWTFNTAQQLLAAKLLLLQVKGMS